MAESAGNRAGFSAAARRDILRKVENLTKRLIDYQVLKGKFAQINELELTNVCNMLPDILMEEPVVMDLNLDTPLYVIGDIHGQYGDLLRMFMLLGFPPDTRYVFLGNYVNRGTRSIETISLLFVLKLRFPKSIFLLRGNHECQHISRHYGFYDECVKRFTRRLWRVFVTTFDYLPLIAVVEEKIFCCHSGMSPSVQFSGISNMQEFKDFVTKLTPRPTEIHTSILMSHYTWSEPDPEVKAWEQNPSGLAYLYGSSIVNDFCTRLKLQQVIRSNEILERGYEFFQDKRLLTIFSMPNFLGTFTNDGAIVELEKDVSTNEIKCRIKVIKAIMKMRTKMTGRMNIMIQDSRNAAKVETESGDSF